MGQGLRNRFFRFSPTYVSAESMIWWLGRECFAKHRCILATRQEEGKEEEHRDESGDDEKDKGRSAWSDEQALPWRCGLLDVTTWSTGGDYWRDLGWGREPHVHVVHSKVIEEYEHMDVLWAMDAVEKVGKELRQILFDFLPDDARKVCRSIVGVGGSRDEKDEVRD